jgi:hypothetical protein
MRSEQADREGSSARRLRRREATGAIILRATERKPEWQRLPGSSCVKVSNVANLTHGRPAYKEALG